MTKTNEIIDFIQRRFGDTDAHWLDGNCYYFAVILANRFPQLEIYYEPIIGHFVAGCGGEYYDASGLVELEHEPYNFIELKEIDNIYYGHIIRDCVK